MRTRPCTEALLAALRVDDSSLGGKKFSQPLNSFHKQYLRLLASWHFRVSEEIRD